jgi:hypothetical protein
MGFFSQRQDSAVPRGDFVVQGFTVGVRSEHSLRIDVPPGCHLKVLSGRAWITVEGVLRDVIADPGDTVPLRAGAVTHVSAIYQMVTFMVTVPARIHNATFALQSRDGERVLSVGARRSRLRDLLADIRAGVPQFAQASTPAGG